MSLAPSLASAAIAEQREHAVIALAREASRVRGFRWRGRRGCFPGRTVVPIDSIALLWGLGSFHCLTQQEPL